MRLATLSIVALLLASPTIVVAAPDGGGPAPKVTVETKAPASQPAAKTSEEPAAKVAEPKEEKPAEEPAKEEKSIETQKWWQAILVTVIQAVAAVGQPILVVLLGALMRKMKLNVEKEKLEWVVAKTVGYGEQLGKKALKGGKPMAGPDILKSALDKGEEWMKQQGLYKKWGSKLGDLVEAKLGEVEVAKAEAKSKTAESNSG